MIDFQKKKQRKLTIKNSELVSGDNKLATNHLAVDLYSFPYDTVSSTVS